MLQRMHAPADSSPAAGSINSQANMIVGMILQRACLLVQPINNMPAIINPLQSKMNPA